MGQTASLTEVYACICGTAKMCGMPISEVVVPWFREHGLLTLMPGGCREHGAHAMTGIGRHFAVPFRKSCAAARAAVPRLIHPVTTASPDGRIASPSFPNPSTTSTAAMPTIHKNVNKTVRTVSSIQDPDRRWITTVISPLRLLIVIVSFSVIICVCLINRSIPCTTSGLPNRADF